MGGGIIDFDTDCPWQLYLFAFIHIGAGLVMYVLDSCKLLSSTDYCSDSERVFETMIALSFIYVGVIFTMLTYHSRESVGKITSLSNAALSGAIADNSYEGAFGSCNTLFSPFSSRSIGFCIQSA